MQDSPLVMTLQILKLILFLFDCYFSCLEVTGNIFLQFDLSNVEKFDLSNVEKILALKEFPKNI